MCQPQKNVDCRDTLVEIGLIFLFIVLATGASLIVAPGLM